MEEAVTLISLILRRAPALAVTLLLNAGVSTAQTSMSGWEAFTSMREINAVVTTPTDMWAASSGGLLHYDMVRDEYERFTIIDGLASNRIISLAIDDSAMLWIGTEDDGLSRLDTRTGEIAPPILDFEGLDINAILPVGDRLYIGTDRGISLFLTDRQEVKETYRKLGNLLVNSAVTSLVLHDEKLWVGTDIGVALANLDQPNLQDPESWSVAGFRPGRVHQLLAINDTMYAATKTGAYFFDEGLGIFVSEYLDEPATAISILDGTPLIAVPSGNFLRREEVDVWQRVPGSIITDVRDISIHERGLWLATATGIRVIPLANQPEPSREPAANQFYDMAFDGNDDFWVTSAPNDHFESFGVSQLSDEGWVVHNQFSGMPTDDLVTVQAGPRGRIWVGSWGTGISILSSGGNFWFDLDAENSPLRGLGPNGDFIVVSDIERDEDGNMWMVNVQFGIVVVSGYPVAQQYFFDQEKLGFRAGLDLNEITIGPKGLTNFPDDLKWLTSPTNGFGLLDDGGTPYDGSDDQGLFIESTEESRLSSDRVSEIEISTDGTIWVATDNGLNKIRAVYDRPSNILNVDSWTVLLESDGLPSRTINDLESDACGNMWAATDGGLSRIAANGSIADALTQRNSGLINNRVNSLLFDEEDNRLWMGTFDGLNRLDLAQCDESNPIGFRFGPNPFINDAGSKMVFDGLQPGTLLRIFTAGGDLVREFDGVDGSVRWNGLNQAGFLVGSGVYFFVTEDGFGNLIRGKFAVLTAL